jgi:SAM-dependent methyltransferase
VIEIEAPSYVIDATKRMDINNQSTMFISIAISRICNFDAQRQIRVLDFGCGNGDLVTELTALGYDAFGCDVSPTWMDNPSASPDRFSLIGLGPYRLPYEDGSFEVVVSTSVLEHARNKEECLREIHRVLKVGGHAMHLFPSKWYLPWEPHMLVPLANFLWPRCPKWWLGLWAVLGVRNGFQRGKSWREVLQLNKEYCREGVAYVSNSEYRRLSLEIFGNYSSPMKFFVEHASGGVARFGRVLPFKSCWAWLGGQFRTKFIVQRRTV